MPIKTVFRVGEQPTDIVNPGAMSPQQIENLQRAPIQMQQVQQLDQTPDIPTARPGADNYNAALLANALRGGPVGSNLEGIGRMAQLISGGIGMHNADEAAAKRQGALASEISGVGQAAAGAPAAQQQHADRLLYAMAMSGDPTLVHAAFSDRMQARAHDDEERRSKASAADKEAHQQALREQAAADWEAAGDDPTKQSRVAMQWGYGEAVMKKAFGKADKASAHAEKVADFKRLQDPNCKSRSNTTSQKRLICSAAPD